MENNMQKTEKWTMYRAVFYNFWYYPNQELIFEDGCAVLRGHNGSGKSVTTQSIITVLLDGDVRSHKLDPFGGKERKITDTVLGEKDLLPINQRTGYIALEFKKGTTSVTKTIGMGIAADREKKQPNIWYFIINGKRIGTGDRDLTLYRTEQIEGKEQQIPLNEKELTIAIEQTLQCGKVYKKRDDYAAMVNKSLFGFESLESYKGLIDLLLQARSPKLSDQNKPEAAAYVLNDSLPSLTEEELRPLTSSIEAIDRLEKDLSYYEKDLKSIASIAKVYKEYNTLALTEKADEYLKSYKRYEQTKKKMTETKKKLEKYKKEWEQTKTDFRKANDDLENYKREKAELGVEEIESLQEKKENEEKRVKKLQQKYNDCETSKTEALRLYQKYQKEYEQYQYQEETKEKELKGFIDELEALASDMEYEEHARFLSHFKNNRSEKEYSFVAWEQSLKTYKEFIVTTKRKLEQYDLIRKQVADLQNGIGNIRMKVDQSQLQIDKQQQKYEEDVITTRDEISKWTSISTSINVPYEVKDFLEIHVDEVYDTMEKDVYFRSLQQHISSVKQAIQTEMIRNKVEIERIEKEMKELQKEITEWKNKTEIEPSFVQMKKEEWTQLQSKNISFIPFYEAFEFKEHVTVKEQTRIQDALYEAGILSAVIVDKNDVKEAATCTTVLQYQEKKENNISDVLFSPENKKYNELLESISFTMHPEGYISVDGYVETNFVTGTSSVFDQNVYIGKASREALRNKKIAELEANLIAKLQEKDTWLEKTKNNKNNVEQIEKEVSQFPSLLSLKESLYEMQKEKRKIEELFEPEIKEKTEKIQTIEYQMKTMMNEIKTQVDYSYLTIDLATFTKEAKLVEEYNECFLDIKNAYKDKMAASLHAENHLESANMQREYEEKYQEELIDIELDIEKTNNIIKAFEKTLQELGSTDILARVEELSRLINDTMPKKINDLVRKEAQLERDMEEEEKNIHQISQVDIPFEKDVFESWEKTFFEQVHLGFTTQDEQTKTLMEQAQSLVDEHGELLDKKRTNIDKLKKRLTNKYQEQTVDLIHYELEFDTKVSEHLPQIETEDENSNNTLKIMREQMSRIVITMNVDQTRVSPVDATEKLSKKIESLQVDAAEKDRELYQEILINTLGDSIRRKIQYVEKWEKEMNKFMEHENLIKFRIKWVPKKTEKENEMDTRKLVDALKKDSRWIDLNEISKHFRSKIKEAKRKFEKDAEVNLQQIMKEVLDYRKWFEFEIYFTKKNAKEKRLNRNSYGELSGGQRVLAMVTPVLAALYAKYLEGREDAPRLFTLDEAFARVDDENINVMFAYIQKLGFNYILNSQSLWGCFESVPSLNIYELSRPDNRPFVSINSYYWNGNKRITVEA